MNILYMGYFCRDELFNELVNGGSNSSHARQQLEKKLIEGLIAEKKMNALELISFLPDVKLDNKVLEETYRGIKVKYLWCNKKSIVSIVKVTLKNIMYILKWALKKTDKVILTYSVNPIHVIPALMLRKIMHFKVITLCSEVSVYRRKEGINLLTELGRIVSRWLDNSFDGYILLTKYMNEIVNKKEKPYIVIEGIADVNVLNSKLQLPSQKAIMYAGGLTQDNGIEILLKGFCSLNHPDLELWICGEGTLSEMVKSYANLHNNIKFWGIQENDRVKELEKQAMLLINPRFSNNEFTKYSFPSKTLEYMSSGTPTVLTRLQGIPNEYFKYVFVLETETEEGIKGLIEEVLSMTKEQRRNIGTEAQRFVEEQKNSNKQTSRVLDFIYSVIIG